MRITSGLVALLFVISTVAPASAADRALGGGLGVGGGLGLGGSSTVNATFETDEETGDATLTLTGDANANSILIVEFGGTLLVVGQARTRIDGRVIALFDADNLTEIVLDLGDGNDRVTINTDIEGGASLTADGGDGNDTLRVNGDIDLDANVEVVGFETLFPIDLDLDLDL